MWMTTDDISRFDDRCTYRFVARLTRSHSDCITGFPVCVRRWPLARLKVSHVRHAFPVTSDDISSFDHSTKTNVRPTLWSFRSPLKYEFICISSPFAFDCHPWPLADTTGIAGSDGFMDFNKNHNFHSSYFDTDLFLHKKERIFVIDRLSTPIEEFDACSIVITATPVNEKYEQEKKNSANENVQYIIWCFTYYV